MKPLIKGHIEMQAHIEHSNRNATRKIARVLPKPIKLLDEDYEEIFGGVDMESCDALVRLGCGGVRWVAHRDD